MNFLLEVEFTSDDIEFLENNVPESLYKALINNEKLVVENIKYLKSLGIKNYKEIFKKFYEVFFMDNSSFKATLDKYETDGLLEFLNKDINGFEFL